LASLFNNSSNFVLMSPLIVSFSNSSSVNEILLIYSSNSLIFFVGDSFLIFLFSLFSFLFISLSIISFLSLFISFLSLFVSFLSLLVSFFSILSFLANISFLFSVRFFGSIIFGKIFGKTAFLFLVSK
jgi:hypothetical protein